MSDIPKRSFYAQYQKTRKTGKLSEMIEGIDDVIAKLERRETESGLEDLQILRPVLAKIFALADKYVDELFQNTSDTMFLKEEIAELSLRLAQKDGDDELAEHWQAELKSIQSTLNFDLINPTIESFAGQQ